MLKKYSISRDLLYATLVTIIFLILAKILSFEIINFKTEDVSEMLLNLSSVLFGFILTILTILFAFDPSSNEIFKKLQNDKLYPQIFKRFFDSLIVSGVMTLFFLILSIYFKEGVIESTYNIFNHPIIIIITYSQIANFIIILFLSLLFLRIYRSLNLLSLLYHSLID